MCDYLVFMTYVGRFSSKTTPPRWNVSCLLVYYRRSEHCAMHQQRQLCSWQVWRLCHRWHVQVELGQGVLQLTGYRTKPPEISRFHIWSLFFYLAVPSCYPNQFNHWNKIIEFGLKIQNILFQKGIWKYNIQSIRIFFSDCRGCYGLVWHQGWVELEVAHGRTGTQIGTGQDALQMAWQ